MQFWTVWLSHTLHRSIFTSGGLFKLRKCRILTFQKLKEALCFSSERTCARQREKGCLRAVVRGDKGELSQKILFLRFRTLPKTTGSCWAQAMSFDQLVFTFHPRWTQRTVLAKMWDVQWSLWGQERGGGRIQSELTICQIICNTEGVIPLCSISRLDDWRAHVKILTKSALTIPQHFKIFRYVLLFAPCCWVFNCGINFYYLNSVCTLHRNNFQV